MATAELALLLPMGLHHIVQTVSTFLTSAIIIIISFDTGNTDSSEAAGRQEETQRMSSILGGRRRGTGVECLDVLMKSTTKPSMLHTGFALSNSAQCTIFSTAKKLMFPRGFCPGNVTGNTDSCFIWYFNT